ncbi:MAG: Fe-S cluster assembly protein SufD [bacterium]
MDANAMTGAEHYLDQYRALADALPGRGLGWLQAQRDANLARFAQVGFPTQRDEDWRYTALKPITAKVFHAVGAKAHDAVSAKAHDAVSAKAHDAVSAKAHDVADGARASEQAALASSSVEAFALDGLRSHRVVFVDGLFAPELSCDDALDGVSVESLAQVLERRPEQIERAFGSAMPRDAHGFTALNNAHSRDGAVVMLAPRARATTPLELLFIHRASGALAQPRNLIIAGSGSQVALIERHVSAQGDATDGSGALTNSVTEILLDDDAQVDYHLLQTQSPSAYHICGVWARQSRGSRLRCHTATLGGALVRNDLSVELAGEGAHCDMLGLYSIAGAQHVDNHTTMVHAAEHCTSRELYKGVLAQRSRAVFHGRIKVEPGAQKTDASQANNNLLLSRHAEIDSKPQLEIYADDVKCAHGATVGQLDADALFYLRARGIDEAQAREMLTFAFVNDVVGEIEIAALQRALEAMLATRLARADNASATLDPTRH